MRFFLLVLSVFCVGHARVVACSPSPDYVAPTNFELVQLADAIIIARLSTLESGATGFELVEILKGPDEPASFYKITPHLSDKFPSHPYSLQAENSSNGGGSCRRGAYADGKLHLLFYSKHPDTGAYFQKVGIYGRDSEDIEDMDAFWLKVVRTYLDIQVRYTPMQQIDQLRKLRRDLLDDRISPQHMSWVMDIENHLISPTPYKPMEFLLQMHKSLRKAGNWPDPAPYQILGAYSYLNTAKDKQQVAKSMMLSKQKVAPEQLLAMINSETNVAILGRLLAVLARGVSEADVLKVYDIVADRMVLGTDDELRTLSDGLVAAINGKLELGQGLSTEWRTRLLALFSRLYEEGFWLRLPREGAVAIAADWNTDETPSATMAYFLAIHDYAPVMAWADRVLADESAAMGGLTTAMRVKILNQSKGPANIWQQYFCGGSERRAAFIQALDVVHAGSGKHNWFERIAASTELTEEDWISLEAMLQRRASRDAKAQVRNGRMSYQLGRAAAVLKKRLVGEMINPSYGATVLTCEVAQPAVSAAR